MPHEQLNILETHEDYKVRILLVPEECSDYKDIVGDMFNPKYRTEVTAEQLAEEEKDFQDRLDRGGVWGIVGEYFDGREWQEVDSCWGLVGDDVYKSEYLEDIRKATLTAYREQLHCPTCGNPVNTTGGKDE